MTGPTVSVPGEETQQPFTEEERRRLTAEEVDELLHPRFQDPPPDAEEADPTDREATDNSNIVDDHGTLEPVSLIRDEFDIDEDI